MSNGIRPGGEANKGLVEACVQCSLDENDRWKQANIRRCHYLNYFYCLKSVDFPRFTLNTETPVTRVKYGDFMIFCICFISKSQ